MTFVALKTWDVLILATYSSTMGMIYFLFPDGLAYLCTKVCPLVSKITEMLTLYIKVAMDFDQLVAMPQIVSNQFRKKHCWHVIVSI